jgi:hypothetical protein
MVYGPGAQLRCSDRVSMKRPIQRLSICQEATSKARDREVINQLLPETGIAGGDLMSFGTSVLGC